MDRTNIFLDGTFFHHFQEQVLAESWKCDFPTDILLDNFNRDCELYKDDTIFKQRRKGIIPWIDNPHQWNKVILETCRELALQSPNIHSKLLQDLHLLEALKDFVEHLHYFYMVASTMSLQGYSFQPMSQHSSKIHDLDKLDPIMLLGYSERFEDNASTSVWDMCVDRHVHVNPHHQVHAIWRNPSEEDVKLYTVGDSGHSNKDSSSFGYCTKDFTDCRYHMECERTTKVYCNDANLLEHCTEDSSAWVLFNGDGIARKLTNKGDSTLKVFNDDRYCNKDAIDLRHFTDGETALRHCRVDALREMVCDKVSRRLQKTLQGVVTCDMWDVEAAFFDGLPDEWMKKASMMMKTLKQSDVYANL